MPASYPTSVWAPTAKVDNVDDILAAHMNDVQAEVVAIENALKNGLAHHLLFVDNTYDIGASGATRPRHLYLAGNLQVSGAGPHAIGGAIDSNAGLVVRVNTRLTGTLLVPNLVRTGNQSTYTVGATDWFIVGNSNSNIAVTLPNAGLAENEGRTLVFMNENGSHDLHATGNVVEPLGSATPGSAILAASAGKWCFMQAYGSNWKILMAN